MKTIISCRVIWRQLFCAVLYEDNYFVPCYMKTIILCPVIWRQLFCAVLYEDNYFVPCYMKTIICAVLYEDNYFVPCYMKTIISCRVIWRQLFRAIRVCFIADIGLHVYYSRCVSTMWLVQINSSTNGCSKWHLLKASACINEMQGPCSSTSQKTQMIFTCSSHQKCKDNCKF